MVKIIINDQSLHEQYDNERSFIQDMTEIDEIHSYLSNLKTTVNIKFLKNNNILNSYFTNNQICINSLPNSNDKAGLLNKLKKFNKINNIETSIKFSITDKNELNNTSYSEAFNNSNKKELIVFLNFKSSYFKDSIVNLYETTNYNNKIVYFCDSLECIQKLVEELIYTFDKDRPPTDEETFLTLDNYQKTSIENQNRAIYKCNDNGMYFTVDNLHKGEKAHIEVFDSIGKHYGEIYTLWSCQDIDTSKKDKTKKINIK